MECPGTSAGRRFVGPCLTWARQLEIHCRHSGMLWSCRRAAPVSEASMARDRRFRGSRKQYNSCAGPPAPISGRRARLLVVSRVDSEAGRRVRRSVEGLGSTLRSLWRQRAVVSEVEASAGRPGVSRAGGYGPWVQACSSVRERVGTLRRSSTVGCRQRAGGQPAYSGIARGGAGGTAAGRGIPQSRFKLLQ